MKQITDKPIEEMTENEKIQYYRNDYDAFMTDYPEVLHDLAIQIDPDRAGMTRDEALSLRAAFKHMNYTLDDYATVMNRSAENKGTMQTVKEWNRTNQNPPRNGTEAGAGTIRDLIKRSGLKYPDPAEYVKNNPDRKLAPKLKENAFSKTTIQKTLQKR